MTIMFWFILVITIVAGCCTFCLATLSKKRLYVSTNWGYSLMQLTYVIFAVILWSLSYIIFIEKLR